jgi:hypothetical protein
MFHLRVREMTLTLHDVFMLISYSIDKASLTDRWVVDQDSMCFHLLRCVPPPASFRGDNMKLMWLFDNFKDPLHDAMEVQLIMYAQVYIMQFESIIFTSLFDNTMLIYFLTLFEDF